MPEKRVRSRIRRLGIFFARVRNFFRRELEFAIRKLIYAELSRLPSERNFVQNAA
jgi:hypothetical protein